MNWTDEQRAVVRDNWGRQSAAEIGRVLGTTRNAVISCAHRIGMERLTRVSSGRPRKQHGPRTYVVGSIVKKPHVEASRIDDTKIPVEQRKTLFDLEARDCRWPVGDPCSPDFFFCGAVAADDRPYCLGHCAVAFESPKPRAERHAIARRAA